MGFDYKPSDDLCAVIKLCQCTGRISLYCGAIRQYKPLLPYNTVNTALLQDASRRVFWMRPNPPPQKFTMSFLNNKCNTSSLNRFLLLTCIEMWKQSKTFLNHDWFKRMFIEEINSMLVRWKLIPIVKIIWIMLYNFTGILLLSSIKTLIVEIWPNMTDE